MRSFKFFMFSLLCDIDLFPFSLNLHLYITSGYIPIESVKHCICVENKRSSNNLFSKNFKLCSIKKSLLMNLLHAVVFHNNSGCSIIFVFSSLREVVSFVFYPAFSCFKFFFY